MCLTVHWLALNGVVSILNVFLECYGNTDNLCHFCFYVLCALCIIHLHCYVCVLIDWFVNRFCVEGMFWIHFNLYFIPSVSIHSFIVCLFAFYMQAQTASFIMRKVFIWMDSYGERRKRWIFDEVRRKWEINPANPCTWGMFSERSRNIPYSKSECYVLSPEFVRIWVDIFHVFSEYYGNTINLCYFKSLCIWWMFVAFIAFVFDRYLCIELKDEANVMKWIWTQRTMQ